MPTASLEDYTPEQIEQMAATYKSALENPATREVMLRATKHLNPSMSIPEIDLKDATRAEFKKANDRADTLEQQIRERDARDRVNSERAALREAGHSKDDIAAIEKIMMDEHIPSYATAAKHYTMQRQVAEPTPQVRQASVGQAYSLPGDTMTALKGGKNSLRKWALDETANALNDLRAGRVKLPMH